MSWENRRINKRKDLNTSSVERFEAGGVSTVRAAVDAYEGLASGSNLASVAKKVSVDEMEVAKVLASIFPDAAKGITSHWAARHWADVAVIAATVSLVTALLWVPIRVSISSGGDSQITPEAFAARDIPAGSIVKPGDLRVTGTGTSGAADVAAVLSGARAVRAIPAGTAIKPGMLGEKTPGRVLRLAVHQIPALDDRKLPLDVDLVFSSRRSPPTGATFRVNLQEVALSTQAATITFRLSEKDLAEVAKWIGSADVIVVFDAL